MSACDARSGMVGSFIDALTQPEAEDLRAAGRRASYGAGVTLFHQGDDAGSVIVLLVGRAKVSSLSSAGREAIVAVRGPGDLVGEMAAIDAQPRSGTVTTLARRCPAGARLGVRRLPRTPSARRARDPADDRRAPALRRRPTGRVRNDRRRRPCLPPAGRAVRALRDSRARRDRDRGRYPRRSWPPGPARRARRSARPCSYCARCGSSRPAAATSACSTSTRCASARNSSVADYAERRDQLRGAGPEPDVACGHRISPTASRRPPCPPAPVSPAAPPPYSPRC